ncbi:ead/Ea22-like family protein [Pseudomonas aeruginosa]
MTDHAELRRLDDSEVEQLLERYIKRFPGKHKAAMSRYFEAVHQELAPLARKLEAERDRLKAENDRLRQGMKGDYDIDAWLDWSKEKERIKSENEALRGALQAVVDDPTWRSNDNTLWPKIIKAMNQPGATSSP